MADEPIILSEPTYDRIMRAVKKIEQMSGQGGSANLDVPTSFNPADVLVEIIHPVRLSGGYYKGRIAYRTSPTEDFVYSEEEVRVQTLNTDNVIDGKVYRAWYVDVTSDGYQLFHTVLEEPVEICRLFPDSIYGYRYDILAEDTWETLEIGDGNFDFALHVPRTGVWWVQIRVSGYVRLNTAYAGDGYRGHILARCVVLDGESTFYPVGQQYPSCLVCESLGRVEAMGSGIISGYLICKQTEEPQGRIQVAKSGGVNIGAAPFVEAAISGSHGFPTPNWLSSAADGTIQASFNTGLVAHRICDKTFIPMRTQGTDSFT